MKFATTLTNHPAEEAAAESALGAKSYTLSLMKSPNTPASVPYPERYNPAKGRPAIVTPDEWKVIRPCVLDAIAPLNHLAPGSLTPFLRALVRLMMYINSRGQDLDVSFVLRADVLAAYAKATKLTRNDLGRLVRLSKEHGFTTSDAMPVGTPRLSYTTPYSDDEIAALLRAAESLSTENRRLTATAVLLLGAGCGIVRQPASFVTADSIHFHDEELFVATEGRCAKVRSEFVELLLDLKSTRPTGNLRGGLSADRVAEKSREWLSSMPGVPTLFVDRLRATYICSQLTDGAGVIDLLAWCGLQSAEAFDGYLAHLDIVRTCAATSKDEL